MSLKKFPPTVGTIDMGDEETPAAEKTTATTPVAAVTVTHQRDIPNGTLVPITVNSQKVFGTKVGYLVDVDKCLVKYGPHTHRRKIHGFGESAPRVKDPEPEAHNGKTLSDDGTIHQGPVPEKPIAVANPASRFDVDTRFQFIEELSDTVINGEANSLIVSGSGGLGKTYTVLARLHAAGKKSEDECKAAEKAPGGSVIKQAEKYDYTVVKGFSTPKSMYRLLYNNKDKLVIFDDCDSILDNPTAINILKAALDSFETRWIHWLSEKGFSGSDADDDLPVRFEFTGKIIFVSNRTLSQIDQALLSRCLYVDVTMTTEEKIKRIRTLASKMLPKMEMKAKMEVVDLLDNIKVQIGDLNIRTFLKVCDLYRRNPTNWRNLAEYVITANMNLGGR